MSLVSRTLEANGIPTVVIGSARDIVEECGVARFLFSDFPLGNSCGKPHEPDLQRQILVEALSSFETMTAPGSMNELPFRWSEDEEWKAKAFAEGDDRTPRHDTPQYQDEEDRRRAEQGGPPSCLVCRS